MGDSRRRQALKRKKIDIAIIIALQEEFREAFNFLPMSATATIADDYGVWYEWQFTNRDKQKRTA